MGRNRKDSSTKSGRKPSRGEIGEVVQRREGNIQIIVTVGFRFCIVLEDQYTKFVFVLKAKSEALARLREFFLSVGTPNKLRQYNQK